MAGVTKNYGFQKPEPNDYVDIAVLNENMDAIDAELFKVGVEEKYTYGTEKLIPGVSALPQGKLHFVYEPVVGAE